MHIKIKHSLSILLFSLISTCIFANNDTERHLPERLYNNSELVDERAPRTTSGNIETITQEKLLEERLQHATPVTEMRKHSNHGLTNEQIKRQIQRLEDLLERNASNPDFDKSRVERRIFQLNEKLENKSN